MPFRRTFPKMALSMWQDVLPAIQRATLASQIFYEPQASICGSQERAGGALSEFISLVYQVLCVYGTYCALIYNTCQFEAVNL